MCSLLGEMNYRFKNVYPTIDIPAANVILKVERTK